MTTERAMELQTSITKEALALMVIHGESVSAAPKEEAVSVAHFEEAIKLIGTAWSLPAETTRGNLAMLEQEREILQKLNVGEKAAHVLPEQELPMNATGLETLDNVWDLFETATRLNSQEQRTALFNLANELAECQNLLDWIEKTPTEQTLPEIAAS